MLLDAPADAGVGVADNVDRRPRVVVVGGGGVPAVAAIAVVLGSGSPHFHCGRFGSRPPLSCKTQKIQLGKISFAHITVRSSCSPSYDVHS